MGSQSERAEDASLMQDDLASAKPHWRLFPAIQRGLSLGARHRAEAPSSFVRGNFLCNAIPFYALWPRVNGLLPREGEQVLNDGKTIELANHTALLRPDGTAVSVEDSAAPLRDDNDQVRGVVFIFKDISERRKADRELAAAKEREKVVAAAAASAEASV